MFVYQRLNGIFAPVVTPFDENERIRYDLLEENIRAYNTTQLQGYMPLGSNGEMQGLDDPEAAKILQTVCRVKAPGKVVVGGCGRESAYKTVEFIKMIGGYGLDLAFILPPHYFAQHMKDENLLRFYTKVADESPVPIVIYNAPKFSSGIVLTPELVGRLAAHDNIVAVKNSSTVPNQDYMDAVKGQCQVLAGNIASLYPGLEAGAIGGVISTASYLPEFCCEVFRLFRAGEKEKAKRLWSFLAEMSAKGIGPMGVPGVKLGMELRGLAGGHVRNPLIDAGPEQKEQIQRLFAECGIKAFPQRVPETI